MSLSYDEIAEILKLIDSSSCDELIVETGDMKLVVRRNGAHRSAANPDTRHVAPGLLLRPCQLLARPAQRPAQGRKRRRAKSRSWLRW